MHRDAMNEVQQKLDTDRRPLFHYEAASENTQAQSGKLYWKHGTLSDMHSKRHTRFQCFL